MSIKETSASYAAQKLGSMSYGARPPRKAARSRGAASTDGSRKHPRAGKEETVEIDTADPVSQVEVHMKLTVQLESRVSDIEASMYCTVFLPNESEIVKEIQNAGRLHSNMEEKTPNLEKKKHARSVFPCDGEGHRGNSSRPSWRNCLSQISGV